MSYKSQNWICTCCGKKQPEALLREGRILASVQERTGTSLIHGSKIN